MLMSPLPIVLMLLTIAIISFEFGARAGYCLRTRDLRELPRWHPFRIGADSHFDARSRYEWDEMDILWRQTYSICVMARLFPDQSPEMDVLDEAMRLSEPEFRAMRDRKAPREYEPQEQEPREHDHHQPGAGASKA